jgi:hypothetical protein
MKPSQSEIENGAGRIRNEDFARPSTAASDCEKLVRAAHGDAAVTAAIERELDRLLDGECSVAGRQFAAKLLARIGTAASVPSLERTLISSELPLAEAACAALLANPAPQAGRALRSALGKVRGRALEAVVNAIAARRDAAAVGELARLAASGEPWEPAIRALGRISGLPARDALIQLWTSGPAEKRQHAGSALLECAQQLAREGDKAAARLILEALERDAAGAHVRRGASALRQAL